MTPQQWRLYDTIRVSAPWSRPARQSTFPTSTRLARFTTQHHQPLRSFRPLGALEDASISRFREVSFTPELPIVLPRQHFRHLPAFARWFRRASDTDITRLDTDYLEQHGATSLVPLELTQKQASPSNVTSASSNTSESTFRQFYAPLSLFLDWVRTAETLPQSTRLYLAQCQLSDLPQTLQEDFPTPDLVLQAGKGDIYDTNVWIGHPPTYTPLHRDPNPNLFVQLAGQKIVRLLSPNDGQALFASVRRQLGQSGGREAAAFRGEEMMQGRERFLSEQAVWGGHLDTAAGSTPQHEGFEAHLEAGDGLFIPKGWWHSIKGVGEGVTASVNWWFR